MAINWRDSIPNAWSSSSRMRQAVAIHKEREDVLVNSSSILSNKDRGRVMDIAVVGSAALLRLIVNPPGEFHLEERRRVSILCSGFGCYAMRRGPNESIHS